MKRAYLILSLIALFAVSALAQSPTQIKQRCQSPYGSIYGVVQVIANGNIKYTPCPTKSSIFSGIVDLSGATVIFPTSAGVITGSGTANMLPKFTAAHTVGNSRIADDATNITVNSEAGTTTIGDVNGAVNGTTLTIDDVNETVSIPGNVVLVSPGTIRTGSLVAYNPGGGSVGAAPTPFASVYIGDAVTNNIQITGTATAARVITLPDATGTVALRVASGTSVLGTGAISSATCATAVTTSATGTATTDSISWGFNSDPTGVTGYVPLTSGMLTIIAYPSANNVNFKVCNNTTGSITPGAITLNWRIVR